MNGAKILVKSLEELGVKQVFGYTGAAILPVMDELGKSSIEIIVNANEQSAAFSASGYSRASETVGVAIVTSGPAITNALTAVADAFVDSIPMVVIAGQVPEHKLGTDSFQHIDVSRVFGATAKKVVLIDKIDSIEATVKDAWYFAKAGRPGPVVIDMPINLQQDADKHSGGLDNFSTVYESEHHLSNKQCAKFFDLLVNAKTPLLYLGGGLNSKRGSEAIRKFDELFRIPSVNTLMAKGVIDETDEIAMSLLGMFGTPYANKVIQKNDFFFAIGVRWDDRVAEKVGFAIDAKIAYIDINPVKVHQVRAERKPDLSFIGDAPSAINDLVEYAKANDIKLDIESWRKYAAKTKKSWPLNYNRDSDIIQQAHVLEMLNERLTDDMIFTTGVGNHQLLAAQYLKMRKPRRFLTSGGFGTMGFGMPNAVGACHAVPDSKVIVIDGDGSFRMNMGELHTIGTLGLNVKILLLNNTSDGMVRNLEDVVCEGRHSATDRKADVNFAEMARVCLFNYAKRIEDKSELAKELDLFLATGGPALLDVKTDITEALYPIVRAGKSYDEMDLGPYIKKIDL